VIAANILVGYLSMVTTLISVACSQFYKINAALADIRQQRITPLEDEQVHPTANCDLQTKLSACIRLQQDIME